MLFESVKNQEKNQIENFEDIIYSKKKNRMKNFLTIIDAAKIFIQFFSIKLTRIDESRFALRASANADEKEGNRHVSALQQHKLPSASDGA